MAKDGRYLFVYGTLMQAAAGALGRAQRDRLARESRSLGPATMAGADLYDLGRYPGLIESADAGSIVHGEALELADPARTFLWLDDYEGIIPGDHDQNEYARLLRAIKLAQGETREAWVYVLRRPAPSHARIRSGRWS